MADIYLAVGENITGSPFADSRYFGNTGMESVGLAVAATGVTISQTVDLVTLPGSTSSFLFQQSGNQLLVFNGSIKVATITVQSDLDGTLFVFSNAPARVTVSPAGMLFDTLAGTALISQTAPSALPIPDRPRALEEFALAASADIVTAGGSSTPLILTPSGTGRISSLQDNDVLTGIGVNAFAAGNFA